MGKKKDKTGDRTEKPFSDTGCRSYAAFLKKDRNDLTFEQHIEGYKKSTALDSLKLRVLIHSYEQGTYEATLYEFLKSGYLSREEWEILVNAETVGSFDKIEQDDFQRNTAYYIKLFKAVSYIVKANPDTMELPFIHKAMANLIRLYRDTVIERKSPDKTLEDLKEIWDSFLPSRQGGNIPYKQSDLQKLLYIGIKQGYTKIDAIETISKKLNISIETLNKILRVKDSKGRPKKL